MLKIILQFVTLLIVQTSLSQSYEKPQFVNDIHLINQDSTIKMSKEYGKLGLTGYIVYQYKLDIKGAQSPVQVSSKDYSQIKFIIKVKSQDVNPTDYLSIMKFDLVKRGKVRRIMTKPVASPYHADTDGEYELDVGTEFNYTVEKYSDDCLIITVDNIVSGEYVLYNAYNQSQVYTFGLHQ